jgi:hypothetical protein
VSLLKAVGVGGGGVKLDDFVALLATIGVLAALGEEFTLGQEGGADALRGK